MRVLGLNGPAGAGKDTMARIIVKLLGDEAVVLPSNIVVKRATMVNHGLGTDEWMTLDQHKDEPSEKLDGKTPRQAYVETGKALRKADPQYIERFYMQGLLELRKNPKIKLCINPSLRVRDEYAAAVAVVGAQNVQIVHVVRPHVVWLPGDIGTYLTAWPGTPDTRTVMNDGDPAHLKDRTRSMLWRAMDIATT